MKFEFALMGLVAFAGCGKNQSDSSVQDVALYARGGTPYSLYLEGESKVVLKKCRVQTDNYRDCEAEEMYETTLNAFRMGLFEKAGFGSLGEKTAIEDVAKKNRHYASVLAEKGDKTSQEYQRANVTAAYAEALMAVLDKIKAGQKTSITATTDSIFRTVMLAINVKQATLYMAEQDCWIKSPKMRSYSNVIEGWNERTETRSSTSYRSAQDARDNLKTVLQSSCVSNGLTTAYLVGEVKESSKEVYVTGTENSLSVSQSFTVICQVTLTPPKIFESGKVHNLYFSNRGWNAVLAEVKPYYEGHAALFLTDACEAHARNTYSDLLSAKVIEKSVN